MMVALKNSIFHGKSVKNRNPNFKYVKTLHQLVTNKVSLNFTSGWLLAASFDDSKKLHSLNCQPATHFVRFRQCNIKEDMNQANTLTVTIQMFPL